MVQIRTLKPAVEIAIPRRTSGKVYRGLQAATVARRRADHPPPTPQPTPCVLWQGAVDNHGYGTWHRYEGGRRRKVRPHRWIMEQIHGPLGADEVVMHLCDNRLCYRFDHLRLGTIAENNADMKAKGRLVSRSGANKQRDQMIKRLFAEGLSNATLAELSGLSVYAVAQITANTPRGQASPASGGARHRQKRNPNVKARGGC